MQQVAALQHLEHRAFLVVLRRLRHDRLVDVGVEECPGLDRNLLEAVTLERAAQLAGDELQAGDQLALLVLGGGLERATHVVHHRQQGLHDDFGGAQAVLFRVALHALAVVVELGLQAAQVIEVLVALGGQLVELLALGFLPGARLGLAGLRRRLGGLACRRLGSLGPRLPLAVVPGVPLVGHVL